MTLTQERPRSAAVRTDRGQAARSDAQWRDVLEARWRDRLQELTQQCVTLHEAASPHQAAEAHPSMRRLMRRAVAARQALAETDAALRRLGGGIFGRCEDCAGEIPAMRLVAMPELRYCPRCAA